MTEKELSTMYVLVCREIEKNEQYKVEYERKESYKVIHVENYLKRLNLLRHKIENGEIK